MWYTRECGTIWASLSMLLKWLKVADVLGVLRGTTNWLVSHKRPNCQGCLTEAMTFSTAWEIMAWSEAVVILLRGRGGALGRRPLSLYERLFSGNWLQQTSAKCPGLWQNAQGGRLSIARGFFWTLNHLRHLKGCLIGWPLMRGLVRCLRLFWVGK